MIDSEPLNVCHLRAGARVDEDHLLAGVDLLLGESKAKFNNCDYNY